jgi:hypothetical protein
MKDTRLSFIKYPLNIYPIKTSKTSVGIRHCRILYIPILLLSMADLHLISKIGNPLTKFEPQAILGLKLD